MVQCVKLGKQLPGLKRAPVPGEVGKRIYNHISQEAWDQWKARQTMFINENQLNLTDFEARQFLQGKMEEFLFLGSDVRPDGYREE